MHCTTPLSLLRATTFPKKPHLAEVSDGRRAYEAPRRQQKRGIDVILKDTLAHADTKGRGMHRVEFDAAETVNFQRVTVSSTGAITPAPHYNTGGYLTWMMCRMGAKVWSNVVPSGSERTTSVLPGESPQQDMTSAMQAYYDLRVNKDRTANAVDSIQQLMRTAKPVQTLLTCHTLL